VTAVISPVTGVQIADIDPTPVEEVDALIARAHDAFPAWRAG
jgi:acyl-CoA reductase-like NAD-dependent aldehyde dehydrogenase